MPGARRKCTIVVAGEMYDSEFLRLALEPDNKRLQEIKDKSVRSEAEKVKNMVLGLRNELTGRSH